jgi:hypothetical protein
MTKPGPGTAPQSRFGIDRAIELMRSLQTERDPDLVAAIITSTLASLQLDVSDVIEDAKSRQAELEARIEGIKARNSELEREIEVGIDEIVKLEASLAEALSVKERFEQAHDKNGSRKPPAP